jgi:heme oxygenase
LFAPVIHPRPLHRCLASILRISQAVGTRSAGATRTRVSWFFVTRRKLGNIDSDLRYLGLKTKDFSQISPCTALPQMMTLCSTLGSRYVIVESSLGDGILTRRFGEHLGMRPDAGCRFFAGYGERTGRVWSAFGELISNRLPADSHETVTAAVSTFELLGQWVGNGKHFRS